MARPACLRVILMAKLMSPAIGRPARRPNQGLRIAFSRPSIARDISGSKRITANRMRQPTVFVRVQRGAERAWHASRGAADAAWHRTRNAESHLETPALPSKAWPDTRRDGARLEPRPLSVRMGLAHRGELQRWARRQ